MSEIPPPENKEERKKWILEKAKDLDIITEAGWIHDESKDLLEDLDSHEFKVPEELSYENEKLFVLFKYAVMLGMDVEHYSNND